MENIPARVTQSKHSKISKDTCPGRIRCYRRSSLTRQFLLFILAALLSLTGCGKEAPGSSLPEPTPSVALAVTPATATLDPAQLLKLTPSPTATETPTPEPTLTPTLEPYFLPQLQLELTGLLPDAEDSGTVACISQNISLPQDVTVVANIYFGDGSDAVESNVPLQQIGGRTCFEVVDAFYNQVDAATGILSPKEGDLSFLIRAVSQNRQIANSEQQVNVGPFVLYASIPWGLPSNPACAQGFDNPKSDGTLHQAWDFIPEATSEFPYIVGTRYIMPSGIIFRTMNEQEEGTNSTWFYNDRTGFVYVIAHTSHLANLDGVSVPLDQLTGNTINLGELITSIGEQDNYSSRPHIHLQVAIPPGQIDFANGDLGVIDNLIHEILANYGYSFDFVQARLIFPSEMNGVILNAPYHCPSDLIYSSPTPTPPPDFSVRIDGLVNPGEWDPYAASLSDLVGDSSTAPVMDFESAIMAQNQGALYLMLKAGTAPASDQGWSVFIYLNTTGSGDTCNKVLVISPQYPNGISVADAVDCNDLGSNQSLYPGSYIWGEDVLELSIDLGYLGNPSSIRLLKVIGYLQNEVGIELPDSMP